MEDLLNTSGLIDDKNAALWDSLQGQRQIEIIREKRTDYLVYSINDTSTIYINVDDINPASFTHELLHIQLRVKNVNIGNRLILDLQSSPKLNRLFNQELLEHIGNCLEHSIMLPDYLSLGYDAKYFITDFNTNKLSDHELAELKLYFKQNHTYSIQAFRLFVGKYFAAKSCPNTSFNYDVRLEQLKKIDKKLYSVLDNFMIAWLALADRQNYYTIIDSFLYELEDWTKAKVLR